MNCRTARDRVLLRRDSTLPPAEVGRLESHLSRCGRCARYATEMNLLFGWVGDLPVVEPPESFDWRLRLRLSKLDQEGGEGHERVEAAPAPWLRQSRRWRLQFVGSALVAAVVVLVAGHLFLPTTPRIGPSEPIPSGTVIKFPPLPKSLGTLPPGLMQTVADRPFIGPRPPVPNPVLLVHRVEADSGRRDQQKSVPSAH